MAKKVTRITEKMKKIIFLTLIFFSITSCYKGIKVDMIVHNALIHSLDNSDATFQAMAIKDGKIIEMGAERQILNRYRSDNEIDAFGKNIYPAFTDAHTHLLLLAQERLSANLKEVQSVEQTLVVLEKYQSRNNAKFIIGRGLQLENTEQKMALANALSHSFKDIPVFIITRDAHTAILNQKAKEYLKIDENILSEDLFFELYERFPQFSKAKITAQLFEIQDELLQYGIVAVHEMGWSNADYKFFSELVKNKKWVIDISAYLLPSEENKALLKNGITRKDKLQLRGFKLFIDGTFGSQTASISTEYKNGENGKINYSQTDLDSVLTYAYDRDLQVAMHCVGDKSAEFVLNRIQTLGMNINNLNWRIEHLQKVNPTVLKLISELHIIPSVQPYHAVSDVNWLGNVLSLDNSFYAYKSLYNTNLMLAIGSDMPVETFSPFEILYAATARKEVQNANFKGFNTKESLTLDEVLRGYTTFNSFLVETSYLYGSLDKNGFATFFIANTPITTDINSAYNYAIKTFIKSKEVYSVE